MSTVKLHLDNFRGYYCSGETIDGRLICSFRTEKNVRGIQIRLDGSEHTEWTKRVSRKGPDGHMHSHYETCSGHNDFLCSMIQVCGQGDIDAGRHEYPFSFLLPNHLPSSFSHTKGWIKYRIKATVDRPWKTDFENSVVFEVKSPINLNLLPQDLKQPFSLSDEKSICCLCCASGPVTMDFYLEKSGFIPGETVKPTISVTNLSNANIDDLTAKMLTTYTFRTESPYDTKEDTELLASAAETGVGAHGERVYNLALEIPSTTEIPNFSLCKLFEYSCIIKVCAEFACHVDLEIITPLTMGNIQFHGQDQTLLPSYVQSSTIGFDVIGARLPPPAMSMPVPMLPGSMPTAPPQPMPYYEPPVPVHQPSAPIAPESTAPPTYEEATTTKVP